MSNITDFLGVLAAGKPKRVTLIESGTGTYTPLKPGNIAIATVQAPGSGGGGNNTVYPSLGGGAGAAGGKRVAQLILFGPVAFELGAPGLGGAHLAQGTSGGSASFGPIVAQSGAPGGNAQNGGVLGRGGPSTPPIALSGTSAVVLDGYTLGGAGGDAGAYGRKSNFAAANLASGGAKAMSDDAAPGSNGQGTNTSPGGGGGSSDHGSGGKGGDSSAASTNTNGLDGTGYGSGGGGAGGGGAQRSGGKGAPGFIHVAEYEL